MTTHKTASATEGNVRPQTQAQQQAKQEKLAAALRANLRRRKQAASGDGNGGNA